MPMVKPGDVFYDKLDDGRYERCVLQLTTPETPNRHATARGGTGEFYRSLSKEEKTAENIEKAVTVIWDADLEELAMLIRIPE